MITKFKLFENTFEKYKKLSTIYDIDDANSYGVTSWFLKDFPYPGQTDSEYVIFENEMSDGGYEFSITLVKNYTDINDSESDYIDLITDKDIDIFDKDAVMKFVNDYDKQFDKERKVTDFNL